MSTIQITLPDGSTRDLESGATGLDLATSIGSRLAKAALATVVDGAMTDLSTPLPSGSTVAIVTEGTPEGREVLRHSTAHVMAQAVTRLWPGAHFAIGPAIADGFYYDFDLPNGARFTDGDMERIEAEMRAIVKENQPFVRSEHSFDEGQKYYLKPMNGPFHLLIFNARPRSFRELPLRLFEFGTVYRYEKSGVVHGLTRVRGFTQDDAHILCTREQMHDELISLLNFVLDLLRDFGLNDFYLEISTRPPEKAAGTQEEWDEAEATLTAVAQSHGLELVLDEGGGAFYGPKISVQAKDAIGRTHQMSTIQLDFQLPQRFDSSYIGSDNQRHRPIMIHRALFGSIERFIAILIEHYAGALPTWLAPEQVRILSVRNDHDDYAWEVAKTLKAKGARVVVDEASEPLGGRIRRAKLEKRPYILVVGDDDVRERTLGINARGSNDPERGVGLDEFVNRFVDEVASHGMPEGR